MTDLPPLELFDILRPSLAPCEGFSEAGTCTKMRWKPECGHIPRGWIGAATPDLNGIRLVLITAEPGDPGDGECYDGLSSEEMFEAYHQFGYGALSYNNLSRGGRPASFHENLRRILDLCWPGDSLDEQLAKTWITPAVLCSAARSGGRVPAAVEHACADRFLLPQLRLMPKAFIIALGGKAKTRLRRAGQAVNTEAQHPSARWSTNPYETWERAAAEFRAWLQRYEVLPK